MNGMIKRLMVVMLAVFMVFGMVITPAEAKNGKGHKPQPTPETTVEPEEPGTPAPDETVEETEEPEEPEEDAEEELPADETVSEETEPAEEEAAIDEPEETAVEEESMLDDAYTVEEAVDEIVEQAFAAKAADLGGTVGLMAEGGTRAASDVSINAGKTVTDANGDGIYELALSVQATSDTSSSASVTKSNVVMVIDVSGSMDYDTFSQYTYDSSTYSTGNRYYSSQSTNNNNKANGTRVYYSTTYNAWYTTQTPNPRSTPYTGTVYQARTRLEATKTAANAVVDALLAYNNNSDGITDVFEISVVKFAERTAHDGYNGTQEIVSHSNSADTIKGAINGLSAGGGTHWRAALEQTLTSADWYKNNQDPTENTSVIFLTDGFPTERGTGNDGGPESNENVSRGYLDARNPARNIVQAGYTLYGIFAFGSDTTTHGMTYGNYNTGSHTGFQFLRGLTNYAYGSGTTNNFNETAITRQYDFNARSTDELVAAFNTIIDHITNSVGYAGVNITDGISLGATSTSVAVNGTAKAETMRYTVKDASGKIAYTVKFSSSGSATFTINNADGTTTTLTDDSAETVVTNINGTVINSQVYEVTSGGKSYKISPAVIDANTGLVKWDLAGLGILESGYTYTVAFDVWPNQIAYDIAADLNNGLYADVDAALDAYKVTDDTERQHIKDAIVHNADGSYSIYTNYEQSIEYYPAESEEDDEGNITWTYGEKQTQDLPHPDPIPLKGSLLPMEKVWESDLAQSELNELLWEDGVEGGTSKEYQITLYVWKADTESELETLINEGDTSKAYITEVLGWDAAANVYDWIKDVAVAPGTMVNIDEAAELGIDITDQSKIREFTNDEGTTLTYYVIEDGHYYYVTEDGADLHFELDTVLYHPMIVDGTLYNVAFGEGKTVERMDPMASVLATNTLKGGLNIHKIVSTTQIAVSGNEITGVNEPVDDKGIETVTDEFTFEIKVWKVDDEGNKSAVYTYDDQIDTTGAEPKTKSGSIGYRIFSNPTAIDEATGEITYGEQKRGALLTEESPYAALADGIFATIENNETTIILTMPANGEIRLVNLPAGTEYQVREIIDEGGSYTYAATESQMKITETEYSEPTVTTDNTVTGTIKGNAASVETYYNWAAAFYVYHSSDNTVEKISMADERVAGTYDAENQEYTYKFNIVDETKEGTLYGGYYTAYSGASMTDQQIINATYDENGWMTDPEGTPYDASKANVWVADQAYTTELKETGGGKGTEMSPKGSVVYYLKEVPDGYIRPYIHFTYDERAENMPIKKLYLFTASDDRNYDGVGYIIAPAETQTDASTCSLIVNIKKYDGTTSDKLTAKSIYGNKEYHGETVKLTRGYLHWTDYSKSIGTEFTFRPCWTTFDDVLVKGVTVRTVNNGTTYQGTTTKIGATDVKGD